MIANKPVIQALIKPCTIEIKLQIRKLQMLHGRKLKAIGCSHFQLCDIAKFLLNMNKQNNYLPAIHFTLHINFRLVLLLITDDFKKYAHFAMKLWILLTYRKIIIY